jgi:hypothetical protein
VRRSSRFRRALRALTPEKVFDARWTLTETFRDCHARSQEDGDRCFQLMATNDPNLFTMWFEHWKDLVTFELIEIGEKPAQVLIGPT